MQNKRTDGAHVWVLRLLQGVAAVLIMLLGWSHGVLYVEGGSMEPALSPGDVIVYRRVSPSLAAGDLVVFQYAGGLVVHRVVAVMRDGTMRTAGDANESADMTPLEYTAVRGEVVFVLPLGHLAEKVAAAGA